MSERKVWKPGQSQPRRKEWVTLDGGDICVWAMTVAESVQMIDRSAIPTGGSSQGVAVVTQIMVSCYDGDQTGAKRLFADHDRQMVYDLSFGDFERLLSAINRVNGKDASTQELLRDFSRVSEEQNHSA